MNEHNNYDYPEPYLSNQRKEKMKLEEKKLIENRNETTKEAWIEHFVKNCCVDYIEAERLAVEKMAELEAKYGRNQA